MQPIRVLLVDDSVIFVKILTDFLQQQGGVTVVGAAGEGQEALALATTARAQVALVDLAMPGMSGLEVIPRLRAAMPGGRIIVLTLYDTEGYRQAALTAGADAFVSKANVSTALLPAIRQMVLHETQSPSVLPGSA